MPIQKHKYPANWRAISRQVREEAGNICEWCHAPNGAWILRDRLPRQWVVVNIGGQLFQKPTEDFDIFLSTYPPALHAQAAKAEGFIKVVLTVAHLDRDTYNNDRSNLAALCQRCHLNHDRKAQHIPGRRYGRNHKDTPTLFDK